MKFQLAKRIQRHTHTHAHTCPKPAEYNVGEWCGCNWGVICSASPAEHAEWRLASWNFSLPITNVSFSALYNSEERHFFPPSAGDFCALWSHYQSQQTVNHTHKALDLTVDIKMSLLVTALERLKHGQTHLGHTKSQLNAFPTHTMSVCVEQDKGGIKISGCVVVHDISMLQNVWKT